MSFSEEAIAAICFTHLRDIGSHRLRLLKSAYGSYANAWSANRRSLLQSGLSETVIQRFIDWRKTCKPEQLINTIEQEGIRVVFYEDITFPSLLRQSSNPPELLFIRGTLPTAPTISIIGTRRATPYGDLVTRQLIPPLARSGICLVSGLALGIDGLVHRYTLEANGTTLAILATGVDEPSVYPREHARLAHDILEHGGCLMSESPPGGEGFKHLFPLRNRLIAGISLATVVVEAALKSGSLITASLALEENRELLAVPGPIWSKQSEGTNHLLKLGAKLCTGAQDVLDALALDRPDLIAQARSELPTTPQDEIFLAHISQPTHIDQIAALAKQPVSHVSSQLSILELKGLVQHLGNQTWLRM